MNFPRYERYKDSGVDWLGDVPEGWDVKRLKFVASLSNSNVDKKAYEEQQAVRLCNYTDVYNNEKITSSIEFMEATASPSEIEKFGLKQGDVLITKDSEEPTDIGIPALVAEELDGIVCGYHLTIIRATQGRAGGYLFRTLQTEPTKAHFFVEASGITRFGLGQNAIGSLRITVPPPEEQLAIAAFLDRETGKIDALITEQRRLIDLLKEKRQAVISHAVTKGLNHDAPMKDSGVEWLGEVPGHWDLLATKRIFKQIVDPAPEDNDYELLSIYTDIGVRPRKELEAKGNKATTTDGYWMVKKGDLIVNKLLAWMGAIGVSNYDGVTSPAYDILRKALPLDPHYYDYLFRCGICFSEFRRYSRGIMDMRLRLYFEEFGQLPMPYPPEMEQQKIANFLNGETAKINTLVAEAETAITLLKERRSALISAAVTGKIDVRGLVVEEVTA